MYSDTLLIVRWTNLHNGDSGYVKSLHRQERYFESTHVVEFSVCEKEQASRLSPAVGTGAV